MIRVLFVCMGNICRSPTAEGMFRNMVASEGLADRIETDSCGTISYHIGQAPDSRAQAAAIKRGYDISDLRARQVRPDDFDTFDYVVAMDRENYSNLQTVCPPSREDRLHMFLAFAPELGTREVPDPFYGGPQGFQTVLDLCETASKGLIADIRATKL